MCPQPPSWQAVALGLLIPNSPRPHLLPSPRSAASWEGRTRKVQVAPGGARLSRPAAADPGGPARDCAPVGRAPRSPHRGRRRPPPSPARGRSGSGQWPFLPGEPAEGGPALLPVPPSAARARRPLGAGSRARPRRLSAAPTSASSKGRAAPGPALPARRTGKVSALRGSPEPALGRRAPATGPGRVPRGCGDPRRPGRGAGEP